MEKRVNWIKCCESMPEQDEFVLVLDKYNRMFVGLYVPGGESSWRKDDNNYGSSSWNPYWVPFDSEFSVSPKTVTHWTALPDKPTE